MSPHDQLQMLTNGNFISIGQAAKNTPYTAEYLSLLARKGKLKAVKMNRDWVTTPQAVSEYLERQAKKHSSLSLKYQILAGQQSGFAGLGLLVTLGVMVLGVAGFIIVSSTGISVSKIAAATQNKIHQLAEALKQNSNQNTYTFIYGSTDASSAEQTTGTALSQNSLPGQKGEVLGASTQTPNTQTITDLIKSVLDQYIAKGKLSAGTSGGVSPALGQAAATGGTGAAPVTYYPENRSSNFDGASVFGSTNLSGQYLSAGNAVLGQTTISNLLATGTSTISSLVVGSISSGSSNNPLSVTSGISTGDILPVVSGSLDNNIITTVAVSNDSGEFNTSMVLGSDGYGRIAYANSTGLHFVKCFNSDCSSSTDQVILPASSSFNPSYTSIAVGSDGFGRVVYGDDTSSGTRISFARCLNAACSLFATSTLDSGYDHAASMALAPDGTARIAYVDINNNLDFAKCADLNCTSFSTTTVDTNVEAQPTSIALASDGTARIAYTTSADHQALDFATCGNASCTVVSNINEVDSGNDALLNPSIVLDSNNTARISYFNEEFGGLGYIECTDTDCSTSNIESELVYGGASPSIVIGSDGFPRIAYTDANTGLLKYLQCENGNCSSKSPVIILDSSGNDFSSPSLAIGSDGFPRIEYFDGNNLDIKFAQFKNSDGSPTVLGTSIGTSTSPFGSINTVQVNVGNNISFNASAPLLDANNQIINGNFSADPLGAEQAVNGDFSQDSADETQLVTNGEFTGNANNWDLSNSWAYGSNHVTHNNSIGGELLTDGNFNTDPSLSGWTFDGDWTYNSVTHAMDDVNPATKLDLPSLGLTAGHTYQVSFDMSNLGGGVGLLSINGVTSEYISNGTFSRIFTANGSDDIEMWGSFDFSGTFDNVSVKEVFTNPLTQPIAAAINGSKYQVNADITGTTGTVTADLGNNENVSLPAGSGTNSFFLTAGSDSANLNFTPSFNFDGTLDNISIKKATSWAFGHGWSQDIPNHKATHDGSQSFVDPLVQAGQLTNGQVYKVQFNVSGTTGSIASVDLGDGVQICDSIVAGSGTFACIGQYNDDGYGGKVIFNPTADFNGSISNVSIKPINSWNLGNGWSYDSTGKAAVHDGTKGFTNSLFESGSLVDGNTYQAQFDVGGTTGTVKAKFDDGSYQTYTAGSGTVTLTGQWNDDRGHLIDFTPSSDFNGSITNVSIKQVTSNSHVLSVAAPTANAANGANLVIQAAPSSAGGTAGLLQLADPTTGYKGTLDLSHLTTDHTYTFPNQDGTIMLANGNSLVLSGSNGDVGVGLSNPQSTLQVSGRQTLDDSGNFELMANQVYPNEEDKYLNNGYAGRIEYNDNVGSWFFETAPSGTAGDDVTEVPMLTILNGGNVGIGTTSPTALLMVQGSSVSDQLLEVASSSGASYLDVTAAGKIGIGTTTPGHLITLSGGAYSDGASWSNASDFNLKENFASVTPSDILQKINSLPISQWNYKSESAAITHIGPTAQDFYSAFHLGGESGNISISTIDEPAVALLGIQALDEKITALQGAINSASSATTSILTVYDPNNFSGDSVGQAKILTGQASVRVSFSQNYINQPIVTADALDIFIEHNISNVDATGFTINIPAATTTDVTFNWHSFASASEQLTVSDGSKANINLVVVDSTPPSQENQQPPLVVVDSTSPADDSNSSSTPASDPGQTSSSTPDSATVSDSTTTPDSGQVAGTSTEDTTVVLPPDPLPTEATSTN